MTDFDNPADKLPNINQQIIRVEGKEMLVNDVFVRIKPYLPTSLRQELSDETLDPWLIELVTRAERHDPLKNPNWKDIENTNQMKQILKEAGITIYPKAGEIEVPVFSSEKIGNLFGPKNQLITRM